MGALRVELDDLGLSGSKASRKLDYLLDQLSRFEGITPCGYFVLSKSATFSAAGLVWTYAIVLLQFKLSE